VCVVVNIDKGYIIVLEGDWTPEGKPIIKAELNMQVDAAQVLQSLPNCAFSFQTSTEDAGGHGNVPQADEEEDAEGERPENRSPDTH
jgi:hypothetical protein